MESPGAMKIAFSSHTTDNRSPQLHYMFYTQKYIRKRQFQKQISRIWSLQDVRHFLSVTKQIYYGYQVGNAKIHSSHSYLARYNPKFNVKIYLHTYNVVHIPLEHFLPVKCAVVTFYHHIASHFEKHIQAFFPNITFFLQLKELLLSFLWCQHEYTRFQHCVGNFSNLQ